MASYPPPYPPPGVPPPYGGDPRQQRRYIKDMGRAQKAAAREYVRQEVQRRQLIREQTRALRRSSILGPVLVLAMGVVLLLIAIGRLPLAAFADWYSRWWPIFLVAAGLVLVAEWVFDQQLHADGEPFVRRGLGGGTVMLLILLTLAGPILRGVQEGHTALISSSGIDGFNWEDLFGSRHDVQQEIDQAFPTGTSLSIDNPRGDVTIVGKSDDGKVHIVVNKQVYGRSDDEAHNKASQMNPRVEMMGSTLSVVVPRLDGGTSDLNMTVPDTGETTVNAGRGAVNISNMRSALNVTTAHGDIEVTSVTGAVNAHINSSGSSFTGHTITGPLEVKGRAQDLTISDVTGQVSLEGEFFGDTHLERLHGPVSFRTSRTQLSMMRLDGDVDLSPHAELTGSQIVGPVRLHTSSRTITLERVAGDVDVANSKGPVEVTSSSPLGNITIENRDGSIHVTLPEKAGFDIDAQTRDGSVSGDLTLEPTTSHELTSLHGRVGDGGPRLVLHTSHADIDVRKAIVLPPAAPETPVTPTPPAPAVKAGKPAPPKSAEKPKTEDRFSKNEASPGSVVRKG